MCEHLVHEPLICCACVFEAERHHFVAKEALVGDKRSLLLIRFIYFDLVVIRKSIHEAHELVLSRRVYLDVNLWEGVAILGVCFVQVRKVYVHPPLPIGFLDHHHFHQPVEIVKFFDEVCLLQLAGFFRYSSIPFLGEHLLLLTNRWKSGRHIQPMHHD